MFKKLILTGFVALLTATVAFATEKKVEKFQTPVYETWVAEEDFIFDKVARPFFGNLTVDKEETFFIIGGSKFVDGKKVYTKMVQAITLKMENGESAFECKKLDLVYPFDVAEGLTIKTPEGLLCVGGHNGTSMMRDVYMLKTDPLRFEKLTHFPVPTAMSCGGFIEGKAYVYEANTLYAFDLLEKKWETLAGIPGDESRQQPAGCVQMANQKVNALFVFGGYNEFSPSKAPYYDAWQYTPSTGKWTACSPLVVNGQKRSTIGAMAMPSGCENILVVGGFNGELWQERFEKLSKMNEAEKVEFEKVYFSQTAEAFNWNKEVLSFQTVVNAWSTLENPTPHATCGAAIGMLKNQLLVIGGELKPKVRCDLLQVGNFERVREFGTLNWVIFLTYLGLMLPFGFFFMKRGKDTNDYFKGGGHIPWWVNGVSIFATMLSSLTFMTIPAMTFISDWRYFPLALAIFAMAPIVIYLYLPFFRRLNITSAYEYLEKRFNTFSRVFASAAFIVFMVARSAVVTFLPSLALSAVAGIDLYLSIILVGSVTVIYSTIGGMEAVVWSDFIQAIVLIGGALVAAVLLINGSGGIAETLSIANDNEKLRLLDLTFNIAEPVLWVTIISGLAANLASYTSDQTIVQRYLTTKDEKGAARSIWFNGGLSVLASVLFYFIGTSLYSFYKNNPQTFDIVMDKPDSLFPTFIVTQMPMGVSGLLIAAIFAATMSTLSSNFNSAATAFVTDFYRRFISDDEKNAFRMAHVTTATVGVLAIGFALLLASYQNIFSMFDVFQQMIGVLTGGLAGLFLLGIFMPRVNGKGAIAGLFASYAANLFLLYVDKINEVVPMPQMILTLKPHLLLYSAVGLIACIVVGYLVSLLTAKPHQNQVEGLTLKHMIKR